MCYLVVDASPAIKPFYVTRDVDVSDLLRRSGPQYNISQVYFRRPERALHNTLDNLFTRDG